MLLDDLFAGRLLVLTGKGGVGKSTVGAALALSAARRGKRVLLAEIDAPASAFSRLTGARGDPQEDEALPGLFTVNLHPEAVMDEYVRQTVKLEALARRILGSPIYHRFFQAAPGLKELMVLGKIMVLEAVRESWSSRPRYDLIILDAPATGHGLSLLNVPAVTVKGIPVGPVSANARKILELLRDPKKTRTLLVAIPEEMAVVEAIELEGSLRGMGLPPRALFLNACQERLLTDAQEAAVLRLSQKEDSGRLPGAAVSLEGALAAARRHIRKRRLARVHETRLRRSLSIPLVRLPFFYDPVGPEALSALADRIEAA
jgi:anion-transporting  ArsA/GET3 family ATPase